MERHDRKTTWITITCIRNTDARELHCTSISDWNESVNLFNIFATFQFFLEMLETFQMYQKLLGTFQIYQKLLETFQISSDEFWILVCHTLYKLQGKALDVVQTTFTISLSIIVRASFPLICICHTSVTDTINKWSSALLCVCDTQNLYSSGVLFCRHYSSKSSRVNGCRRWNTSSVRTWVGSRLISATMRNVRIFFSEILHFLKIIKKY